MRRKLYDVRRECSGIVENNEVKNVCGDSVYISRSDL